MTVVISNCSKRKRVPLDSALRARDLESGSTEAVAARWGERLAAADLVGPARALYGGRAFVDAVAAARVLDAPLLVVSAGLGLVEGETRVPAYGLTTVRRDVDCILEKTGGTAAAWWAALERFSPFQSDRLESESGPILAALPAGYLSMVAEAWGLWPKARLARLRLFSKAVPEGLSEGLRDAWMPYDDRLDAVADAHGGTQGDFAQRALRHFASTICNGGDQPSDRDAVRRALDGLSARQVPVRRRLTDEAIEALIDRDWDTVAGRSGAMLRRVRRDLGVACEQSRFKALFKSVQARRLQGEFL